MTFFCNMVYQGGLVTTPLMNLKLTGPKYDCLVPWYRVGSPLSIDTKIMKNDVTMTFSNMAGLKKRIFGENRPRLKRKNLFFLLKKSSKYRNFTRFFAYKEGKWCFYQVLKVLAPYHADIFQNGDLKYLEVATTLPTFEL